MIRLNGLDILVVDDEVELCEVFADEFRFEGANVRQAYGGHEALKIVQSHHIDIILSDVKMPNGSGIDLLKQIKSQSASAPLVILITGFSDGPVHDAFDLGAEDVLAKPCSLDQLVESCLRLRLPIEQRWGRPPAGLQDPIPNISVHVKDAGPSNPEINFGRGGACLKITAELPRVGDVVRIHAKFDQPLLNAPEFSGIAKCRWANPETTAGRIGGTIGLEFLHLNQESIAMMSRLLQQSLPIA